MAVTDRTAREWYAQKPEVRGALRIHVKIPADGPDSCHGITGESCSLGGRPSDCVKVNKLKDGAHACWRTTARCGDGGVWEELTASGGPVRLRGGSA